jgi:hypothetical protein
MTHPTHQPVVDIINQAIGMMDDFIRMKIDLCGYSQKLGEIDADYFLEKYKTDFKKDQQLIYYLDSLTLLSSLQHQLDFQIAEYGANVASEDITCLRKILDKFPTMLRTGLLKRMKLSRKGSTLLVRFTITPEGERVLDYYRRDKT